MTDLKTQLSKLLKDYATFNGINQTVSNLLKRHGLQTERQVKAQEAKNTAKLLALYKKGLPYSKIASQLNITDRVVEYRLNQLAKQGKIVKNRVNPVTKKLPRTATQVVQKTKTTANKATKIATKAKKKG